MLLSSSRLPTSAPPFPVLLNLLPNVTYTWQKFKLTAVFHVMELYTRAAYGIGA
jgi:hypothetical protein